MATVLNDTGNLRTDARHRAPVARERRRNMPRAAYLMGVALALFTSAAAADGQGRVSCTVSENGQPASGVISIQRDGNEVSTASCNGKEFSVPAGNYTAALRLDGAFDGPEQKQPLSVQAGAANKLTADFATGTLEVHIASQGKRAAGMAIIKRAGQQLGTLGSGVLAHLSAGKYHVLVRYRTQEKDLGDITLTGGQHVSLDANFE